ncbi:MAG: c-type cytochrome [Nitrospirae bacterium]|nr:c-type cytochrome [Candidatus Troglogloeales bacterium]
MQFNFSPVTMLLLFVFGGILGCQPKQVAEGKKTFMKYCSPCHGEGGAGNGYNANNLDPHARDLTDKAEPYMAKLSNKEIYEVIEKGGAGVDLAPTMPTFGKVFSEQEIWSLVSYIRTLHPYKGEAVKFDEAKPYNLKRPHAASVTEADFDAIMTSKVTDEMVKAELIETGATVFDEFGCIGCHKVKGKGGLLGPNLSRAGFMLQPQFIYRWVRNPQSFKPNTRMPNLDLPEEDALAVTLYLGTLKDPQFGGDGTGRETE